MNDQYCIALVEMGAERISSGGRAALRRLMGESERDLTVTLIKMCQYIPDIIWNFLSFGSIRHGEQKSSTARIFVVS